jgi:hypothetical protein
MPRYFFNIHGKNYVEDQDGSELENAEQIAEEARDSAREILAGGVREGLDHSSWSFNVTDEAGLTVFTMAFATRLRRHSLR